MKDITKPETMLELQGDLVLVSGELLASIVRVMDGKPHGHLELASLDKAHDTWEFSQELGDSLVPAVPAKLDKKFRERNVKWTLEA